MAPGLGTFRFMPICSMDLMNQTDACSHCVTRNECVFTSLPCISPVTGEPLVRERRFHRGEVLREEGDTPGTLHMIKVGTVLASRAGVDGVSRPVIILCRGQAIGRLDQMETGNALTCRAVSAGRLCEVRLSDLGAAASSGFRALVVDRYIRTFSQLADWAQIMRIKGVAGQIAATLVQMERCQRASGVIQLPGHSALAALLGTSRETIARVLAQLELSGALARLDRTHCRINRAKLISLLAA